MNKRTLWTIIITILTLWIGSGFIVYFCFPSDERGSIGDMFGAINALFSGAALAGIIITIYLQRDELTQTRRIFEQQSFESTFFKMLEIIEQTKNKIELKFRNDSFYIMDSAAMNFSGIEAVGKILGNYHKFLVRSNDQNISNKYHKVSVEFFLLYEKVIINWLKTIQQTLQLVDKYKGEQKYFYGTVVGGQLKAEEKLLLFYFSLAKKDQYFYFNNFLYEYEILEAIPQTIFPDNELYEFYLSKETY